MVKRVHQPSKRLRFDPWVRKIPWQRKWLTLQYSCLGNPMDRGAWQAMVLGVTTVGDDLVSKLLK